MTQSATAEWQGEKTTDALSRRVLLLATEIWQSHGGIQRYMRDLIEISARSRPELVTLSLNDRMSVQSNGPGCGETTGCGGSKLLFCSHFLRAALRDRGSCIIVGHINLVPLAYAASLLGFARRYVLVLHGIEAWRRYTWTYRTAARRAFAIVATSRYTAREFCYLNGVPPDRCTVIPLSGGSRSILGSGVGPAGSLRLVTVTRLSASDAYKGIDTVLHALSRGRAAGLNITLDIVGDGNDRDRLQKLAYSLHIDDLVQFHGAIPDENMTALLRTCHLFVMPSKYEGFGIAFVEAMAAGLPCIGANHGGTPEVIAHGDSGFLIEYGDTDQLLFYIRQFLEAPGLYRSMSDAARRRAGTTLGRQAMADHWTQLLRGLNSGRASLNGNSRKGGCP